MPSTKPRRDNSGRSRRPAPGRGGRGPAADRMGMRQQTANVWDIRSLPVSGGARMELIIARYPLALGVSPNSFLQDPPARPGSRPLRSPFFFSLMRVVVVGGQVELPEKRMHLPAPSDGMSILSHNMSPPSAHGD